MCDVKACSRAKLPAYARAVAYPDNENKLRFTKRETWGRVRRGRCNSGAWDEHTHTTIYKKLYIRQITKDILYTTLLKETLLNIL